MNTYRLKKGALIATYGTFWMSQVCHAAESTPAGEEDDHEHWGSCVVRRSNCNASVAIYNRPLALRGHVSSFLWKWKLHDFAFETVLVGHLLNKIIVIWFSNPHWLKMCKSVAGHVTKTWFLKLWITAFWHKRQGKCWKDDVVTFIAIWT